MTTPFQRAEKYLSKCPPAISGSGGHNQTFSVACALVNGFSLPEHEAWSLLQSYNQGCQPPWSEKDLRHKLESALTARHEKPRGHLLTSRNGLQHVAHRAPSRHSTPMHKVVATPKPAKPSYDLSGADELPDALDDGARQLLRSCFEPGEGVRVVNARLDEDGHETPDGAGPCLSREEWLRKLDAVKGNPNGIFSSTKKTGIYISINPLKVGGSKDSDVTCYRHALVEFDEGLSPSEQFNLYAKSRLPCAAIIYSGGKSVHAWVKIDAASRAEYDDRVKALYQHFEAAGYTLDQKNKNPSRLSRLPHCIRFDSRQELLALNSGCESFTEWLKHIDADGLGECDRFSDLIDLKTDNDPNCIIGFRDGRSLRYLCKGKSAWLLGPSGIGKSSLISEFAIAFALGNPSYGITPARPLKSIIIQAENDRYDLAEMVQGIARAYKLNPFINEAMFDLVDQNVLFKTEDCTVGDAFVEKLHRIIDRDKPDLVWLDPFLSFAGIDVAKQDQVTPFLRERINPVLKATGVVLIGVHHTGKPKGSRETANWTAIDWAYAGLGSSELVNWARAVMMLRPVSETQFELKLSKRGPRAGATHPDGTFTSSIWLQHSKSEIRWEQIDPPAEAEPDTDKSKGGRPSKLKELSGCNLHEVLSTIPKEGETASSLGNRLRKLSRKLGKTLGATKCRTDLLDALIENNKLRFDDSNELYFRGVNA